MHDAIADVIERLRSARSLPWLKVLDGAKLDRAVDDEPDVEAVVAPYVWLLRRVGEGVKLTAAGYLPPAMVTETMQELGWADHWIGKQNREDMTFPVLELRESAQRFGLLRKYRGQLLVTKAGRRLRDDPVGLWWHLSACLPDARSDPERDAGVLYLLTVAAGLDENDEQLASGMTILGWRDRTRGRLSSYAAFDAARDTWLLFDRLGLVEARRGPDRGLPTAAGRRLAHAALRGRAATATSTPPAHASSDSTIQLKIALDDVDYEVWRRLLVPASLTMRQLHDVLQIAMGWEHAHLHSFDVNGVLFTDLEDVDADQLGDESTVTVGQAVQAASEFRYEYDFGDGWSHTVVVESIKPAGSAPRLVDGARACPPEDCGGPYGFHNLLEALADATHPDHRRVRNWVGESYDPDALDVAKINESLDLVLRLGL